MKLDNPLVVQWAYASEERLATRNATYSALVTGPNPDQLTFELVAGRAPQAMLEVGCGMGERAERIGKETAARVQALDISEPMVDLTRERGVDVVLGDVQAAPDQQPVRLQHTGELPDAAREADRETMRRFVAATTTRSHFADGVPELTEPFSNRCAHTMFLAEQPR